MATMVGSKGQVVIQKAIRDKLGIEPGCISVQRLVGDHVELHSFPPEHDRSLKGTLAGSTTRSLDPRRWEEIRARAWAGPQTAVSEALE